MAQNETLRRYIEACIAFTEMTRGRAEEVVRDLARSGEVQWDQVQNQVDDLIEWSRRNTEQIVGLVRREVSDELTQLGIATREHVDNLERRLDERIEDLRTWTERSASRAAPTKATPAKATPTKTTATKTTAKKAPAKQATVKKAPAKQATAKKTTAQPAPAAAKKAARSATAGKTPATPTRKAAKAAKATPAGKRPTKKAAPGKA
jgi:DNA-binding protein HU-beta